MISKLQFLSWDNLTRLGIKGQNKELNRRRTVFNKLIIISLVVHLLFIPITGIIGSIHYFLILFFSFVFMAICLSLNRHGLFAVSVTVFMSTLLLSVFMSVVLLGNDSGLFLFFIPISALPLLYNRSVYSAIPVFFLCLVLLLISTTDVFSHIPFVTEQWRIKLFFNIVAISVLFLGFFYNAYFKVGTEEKDLELISLNRQIGKRNEEILRNIKVARNIQTNLLPYDWMFRDLFPDSFVFYKPRDIVSGDFYWVEKKGDIQFCAVIDCTGHGVPGAFVSILGHQGLNRCIQDLSLSEPADVLNKLHEIMHHVLRKEESLLLDGMDLSLFSIQRSTGVIKFAGAHNSMMVSRSNDFEFPGVNLLYRGINHSLYKVPAQLQSVGSQYLNEPFRQIEFKVRSSDTIYLSTDGYVDQFGGPRRKKMMHKQFRKLLISIPQLEMKAQKEEVEKQFESWRAGSVQIDDVCVIGIRFDLMTI